MRAVDNIENEDFLILAERFEELKVMDGKADSNRSLVDTSFFSSNEDGFHSVGSCSSSTCSSTASSSYRQRLGNDSGEKNIKIEREMTANSNSKNNTSVSDSTFTANNLFHQLRQVVTPSPLPDTRSSSQIQSFLPSRIPSTPSHFDAGRLINKEMLQFDHTERNAIYEEVHGVTCLCPDESQPGMVETALRNLDHELDILPAKQKVAYRQSFRYPDSYIHTRDFKMRFLRAELFDPYKAAIRLTLCVKNFLDFFGENALERPIQVSDFSKQEQKVLAAGRIQILPFRDRGGRRICVGFPSRDHQFYNPIVRVKIHIYLWWVASECVETQRKGMVIIIVQDEAVSDTITSTTSKNNNNSSSTYNRDVDVNNNSRVSYNFAKYYMNRKGGLPGRMVSCHLCTPDTPYFSVLRTFFTALMGGERSRLRIHVGLNVENRYKLSGFGISLDQLPLTESGKIKTAHFRKWIQLRRKIEGSKTNHFDRLTFSPTVECPLSKDVIFRPSQSMMCHPGNVMFRSLVESKHIQHSVAPTREAKVQVTKGVIQEVLQAGGRFLVWDKSAWWTELTDEKQIYAKTAVFFRNSKISARAKTSCQSTKSSTYIFAGENSFNEMTVIADETHSDGCINSKRRKMAAPCFAI